MRTLNLRRSGLSLSRIICGGWQAGREYWVGIDDDDSVAALRTAFERGVTTFDTAESYGDGHSERILARALGSHRDEIVIATKVSWDHLRREQIIEACERSLRNLGTDRIDLYQIHWPAGTFGSEVVPIEESMEALVSLRDAGKIRAIGVSNFDHEQLARAAQLGPVETVQPPYSLVWRNAERELAPFCEANDIAILAYSPLAQGLLSGRWTTPPQLSKGDNRRANLLFRSPHIEPALAAVDAMRPHAQRLGCTMAQLALAWIAHRPGCAAIAGARNSKQAADNAAAGAVTLSPQLQQKLADLCWPAAEPFYERASMWTWTD